MTFPKILPRRHIATGEVIPRETAPEAPPEARSKKPRGQISRKAELALDAKRAGVQPTPGRSEAYLAFVRKQPCCVPGCKRVEGIHAHHFGPRGKGQKCSDFRTVPLCVECHTRWHTEGTVFAKTSIHAVTKQLSESLFLRTQVDLLVTWAEAS